MRWHGGGRGEVRRAAQPLLGDETFTCQAFPDYPARNLSFLPLASYGTCILGWGDVYRLCPCHLELLVGRNHTLLLTAPPHLEQPMHRKGVQHMCVKKQIMWLGSLWICSFILSCLPFFFWVEDTPNIFQDPQNQLFPKWPLRAPLSLSLNIRKIHHSSYLSITDITSGQSNGW